MLIKYFAESGLTVGTIKHIHHPDFTIDKEGSDTWRYRHAGSKAIAYFSPSEAGLILSVEKEPESIEDALKLIEWMKIDLLIIEGFHRLIAKRIDVGKIIVFKDFEDLEERIRGTEQPIIALCTFNRELAEKSHYTIDFLILPQELNKLINAVDAFIKSP